MIRTILVTIAALLISVLLVLLIRESRAVDGDYYVSYGEQVSQLRQNQRDLDTLLDTLATAGEEARAVPAAAITLLDRIRAGSDVLNNPPSVLRAPEVAAAARAYGGSVGSLADAVSEYSDRQGSLARAAALLRTDSPAVVRDLRSYDQQPLSQMLFGLTVDLLDFADGNSALTAATLESRIGDAERAASTAGRLPSRMTDLLAAARTVVAERDAAADAAGAVRAANVSGDAQALYAALSDLNRGLTGRADRARLLLAVVSVLLLVVVAFIGMRLRQSYAALNDTNAELEQFNIALEQRVSERTAELSSAYDELKESQAQLVQAEKMSSLGELVAGISHEINTPLWYLLSNTTLIQERMVSVAEFVEVIEEMLTMLRSGNTDKGAFVERLRKLDNALHRDGLRDDLEESQDLLKDSIEGLEQLSEMAQSLKDFSRLDRAAVDEVDLNEGLEKTLVIAKNVLKGGVRVEKSLGELPRLRCAPSQINQVLLNLVKNAADALDGEGVITLRTWHDDGHVHVSVADDGCGMDEETLAKVRDPFFTTKEVGKGTGLGLSICQKIIDAHDGELKIESAVGEGSTFTLSLPLRAQDEQARALAGIFDVPPEAPSADATDGAGEAFADGAPPAALAAARQVAG
jgi:signal transduction histidine kinase